MANSAGHITAVYTGVFDPVHFGHLDVIRRGSRLVDRLIVGVGDNPEKSPLFEQDERVQLIEKVVATAKLTGEHADPPSWREWTDEAKIKQRVGPDGWFSVPAPAVAAVPLLAAGAC